jgi:hypothetical protein
MIAGCILTVRLCYDGERQRKLDAEQFEANVGDEENHESKEQLTPHVGSEHTVRDPYALADIRLKVAGEEAIKAPEGVIPVLERVEDEERHSDITHQCRDG